MMETFSNQFEQKLDTQLKALEQRRESVNTMLASQSGIADIYHNVLVKAREISIFDPRKGEPSPKEFIRVASSAPLEARQAVAFKGPTEGMAKPILKNLPCLGLGREENLASALVCVLEDSERCFTSLSDAKLPVDDQVLVVLAALKNHPILNFEEFKTQEVIYQTANTDDPREMQEIQRRFEQVRGKKTQHIRKHILNSIPVEIKQQPDYRMILLQASLRRDTFGTLEAIRESLSSEEALKSNTANLLDGIAVEEKLNLLEIVANLGMGLATTYLDLFSIPPDPEWHPKLQKIFQRDVTAGHSLFGVYAFEGMQNYPFNLGRIESTLPRRITNSEATEYLKRGEAAASDGEPTKQRTFTSNEVGEAVTMLQEKDVRRFLEALKWGISHNWKACVQDRKKEIIFGDYDLKVRDILFLVAHSLFEEEEKFEEIFNMIEKNHPFLAEDTAKIYTFANRYYFFNVIGLNASFLFNRSKRLNGSIGTLIEEISDYQVHNLLHICMSIYIRVGDILFRDLSIAWPMLIGQCEGKMDAVFHEISQLFDSFDTLLTIIEPVMPNLPAWINTLIDALAQDVPDLPVTITESPKQAHLGVTTNATINRVRDLVNRYSLDALFYRAKMGNATPISVIQTLKVPRSKTDKLRTLLSSDPKKEQR
ncbi:MAG: hypothetical protein LBH03_06010 [Holophagales bacterium]|jgi:hypothetical protein|nr:hypothetical protein [Holophagales bacterium]